MRYLVRLILRFLIPGLTNSYPVLTERFIKVIYCMGYVVVIELLSSGI
jgi:hypothetical protein